MSDTYIYVSVYVTYVYLGLAELVEVPEELKNMSTTATGERKWWTVVS